LHSLHRTTIKTKPDFDASDRERIILLLLYFNLVILLIASIQLNLK
jgi:hypothetical protein